MLGLSAPTIATPSVDPATDLLILSEQVAALQARLALPTAASASAFAASEVEAEAAAEERQALTGALVEAEGRVDELTTALSVAKARALASLCEVLSTLVH